MALLYLVKNPLYPISQSITFVWIQLVFTHSEGGKFYTLGHQISVQKYACIEAYRPKKTIELASDELSSRAQTLNCKVDGINTDHMIILSFKFLRGLFLWNL